MSGQSGDGGEVGGDGFDDVPPSGLSGDGRGDENSHDAPMSERSDDSVQLSPRTERSKWTAVSPAVFSSEIDSTSATNTSSSQTQFLPSTIQSTPAVGTSFSSPYSVDPTMDLALIGEGNIINDPKPVTDPALTNELASSAESASTSGPTGSSPAPIQTYIHPPSEGGSVTWKNHDDLVFRAGKDRGPRVPAPILPTGYKTKGPLKDFPFDKLRRPNFKKAPLIKFQDEYLGQQDQTPTELVKQIMAYFEEIEDDNVSYLLDRSVKIQGLNDAIRIQEQEINRLKGDNAKILAINKYNVDRDQKMKEQEQELKDKEAIISDLRNRLTEVNAGNCAAQESGNEEFVQTLMSRIVDLEAELKKYEENRPALGQLSDPERSEGRIKQLLNDIEGLAGGEDLVEGLQSRIMELEQERNQWQEYMATSTPNAKVAERARTIKFLEDSVKVLEHTIQERKPSTDPKAAEQYEIIQSLAKTVDSPNKMINALETMIQKEQETNRATKERPTSVAAVPVKELIKQAQELNTILDECKVRVLLLQAKKYIDEREYSAGVTLIQDCEITIRKHLPHLNLLYGRANYLYGRGMFGLDFYPETINALEEALSKGFDQDCGMVDGDCVKPLLSKARAEQRKLYGTG